VGVILIHLKGLGHERMRKHCGHVVSVGLFGSWRYSSLENWYLLSSCCAFYLRALGREKLLFG